jgi:tripartite-type tricarboxylate transporter receptor subunit TctC
MDSARRKLFRLAAGSAAAALSRAAWAQAYPARPIRLVIPFPPGGVFDSTGRPWAEKVKSHLGTIVVENVGGAGSSVGTAAVARAQPDGYTLLLGGFGGLVVNPIASSHLPYDPLNDLEPIAVLGKNPSFIDVHPSQPFRTLKELIDFAKHNPGELSFGSAGTGSANHLVGELLKSLTGAQITHVPYRGAGPALGDLIGGHIPMLVQSVTGQAIEMHRAGKMRILAVTSAKRLMAVPEIATTADAGVPDLVFHNWIGLFGPKGTPRPIVERIAQATRAVMADQELQRVYLNAGFEIDSESTPEATRHLIEEEIARWTPVIKAIGLKLD